MGTRSANAGAAGSRRTWKPLALAVALGAASLAHAQEYRFDNIAGGFLGDGLPAAQAGTHGAVGIAFDAAGYGYIAQFAEHRVRRVAPEGVSIATFVGTGEPGFGGDGGPASQAQLNSPAGVVIDGAGNLYIADAGNHRVRKVTPAGVISTIAGNGVSGYSGDGGAATDASLVEPYGLALDAAGNLYISDWQSAVVRKVTPGGTISTVAGNGTWGFSGDGGPATSANLNLPEGLSVDTAGNLFIADALNHRIRKVSPGGTITTVAGNGTGSSSGDGGLATDAAIYYPFNVMADPEGGLIITDTQCRIRRVLDGVIHTIAGDGSCEFHGDGGPAASAGIGAPEGLALDDEGNLYFVDTDFGRIRRVRYEDRIIETMAGIGTFGGDGGRGTNALLSVIAGIGLNSSGELFISDFYPNHRIRKVGPGGAISTFAGNGQWFSWEDYLPATASGISQPRGIAFDGDGNTYFADTSARVVRKVTPAGVISTFAGNGTNEYIGDGGPATNAGVTPYDVAVDAAGNVYIADRTHHNVRRVSPAGMITTVAGNGVAGYSGDGGSAVAAMLNQPNSIAIDARGDLLIADASNYRIRKVHAGTITTIAGNGTQGPSGEHGPATAAGLAYVRGMAVGADGTVFLVGSRHLSRITPDGNIHPVTGRATSGVHVLVDVQVDPAGRLYVATSYAHVVRGERVRPVAYDFNGDRVSDVFWRSSSSGANSIWLGARSTSQQAVTGVTSQSWQVAGIGDFDGDGVSDAFWRDRSSGRNTIWLGADSSRKLTVGTLASSDWEVAGIGDFNGDSLADVLWRHRVTGANMIWGAGDASRSIPVSAVTNVAWKVSGTGDYNGDGHADILWHNDATGANVIWRAGDARTQTPMTRVTNLDWQVAGSGDFNGDGRDDALFRNRSTGANVIWLSANSRTGQSVTGVTNLDWTVAAVGDYNGDGKADIAWRNLDSGANVIWRSGNSRTGQAMTTVTSTSWKIVD